MSFFSRFRSGLALPSATVALTPARAFTSRLRRRYRDRYLGRYRFARLIFIIDTSLVALVLAIFGVGVWLAIWQPKPDVGIHLVLQAPPITTATTLAFEAHVEVQDGKVHPGVRLRWILPVGTEVVSASPPVDSLQEVIIGDLQPGEKRVVRLAARLFVPPGSARIGFEVRTSAGELLSGYEVRPVVGSALHIEPVLTPVRSIPGWDVFMVKNDGNTSLDCARVQTTGHLLERMDAQAVYHYPSPQGSQMTFDTIKPGERRFFRLSHAVPGEIQLFCGRVELQHLAIPQPQPTSFIAPLEAYTSSTLPGLLVSTPGQVTTLYVRATEPIRVLVYHPFLQNTKDGFRWFDVASGSTQIVLPLDTTKAVQVLSGGRIPRWFVWLTRAAADGTDVLGAYDGIITTPFVVDASARYYAVSGGQIGAGPLPPQVGQMTRYWVQWKLAPTQADLSNVEMRAVLPEGVTFNDMKALPNGGELIQEGGELVWRLPFLPTTSADTSVTFALELTPVANMRGKTPNILGETYVQALENRSGITVQAQTGALDTSLLNDEQGIGKGVVR